MGGENDDESQQPFSLLAIVVLLLVIVVVVDPGFCSSPMADDNGDLKSDNGVGAHALPLLRDRWWKSHRR